MNGIEMREEFEEAIVKMINEDCPGENMTVEEIRKDRTPDGYVSRVMEGAWWGWRASRAALSIELKPPHNDYDYDDSEVTGAVKYYQSAIKAVEAAGVKVK